MPKPPSTAVMPDPKRERRSRRKFTTEYTLRVIAEADACARGELGPMLRREGLYSNQLHQWRRELADGGVALCVSIQSNSLGSVLSVTIGALLEWKHV